MKVLVTGGAGCIGIKVCEELIKKDIDCVLFDLVEQVERVKSYLNPRITLSYGSILDISSLNDAMFGCDAVIHLAAYLGVKRTETNMLRCLEINIDGTRNVLDCGVKNNISKIIFASSSEVYGEPLENPVTEKSMTQGKTVYAISKLAGEELCKAYSQRYGLDYSILRYFNTYGPFQAAQFVIPRFIMRVKNNLAPVVYGDGTQSRSFCFSEDTARATVSSLLSDNSKNQIYNIGNPDSKTTIEELATLICQIYSPNEIAHEKKVDFNDTDRKESREIFQRFGDISKAKQELFFEPKVSLKQGLEKIRDEGIIFEKWETEDLDYSIGED